MYNTVKYTLTQQIQIIDHDYRCLEVNMPQATDFQLRNLEAIRASIDSLRGMIDALPNGPVALALCHDMRNQLTVIRGFTELLKYELAGSLDAETMACVDEMLDATRRIEATLDTHKEISEPLKS